jgi:hypothetical protein
MTSGTGNGTGFTSFGTGQVYSGARRLSSAPPRPRLAFAPLAWLKYNFFCHHNGGRTEVAGFGHHEVTGHRIRIVDFVPVLHRTASAAYVDLDAEDRLRVMEEFAAEGVDPAEVLRCWLHTHPGNSVSPSSEDWDTFSYYYDPDRGNAYPYALMVILGQDGTCGCHMAVSSQRTGPDVSAVDRAGFQWVGEIEVDTPSAYENIRASAAAAEQGLLAEWESLYDTYVRPGISTHTWGGGKWGGTWAGTPATVQTPPETAAREPATRPAGAATAGAIPLDDDRDTGVVWDAGKRRWKFVEADGVEDAGTPELYWDPHTQSWRPGADIDAELVPLDPDPDPAIEPDDPEIDWLRRHFPDAEFDGARDPARAAADDDGAPDGYEFVWDPDVRMYKLAPIPDEATALDAAAAAEAAASQWLDDYRETAGFRT